MTGRGRRHEEEGQVLPVLLVLVVATLALGFTLFSVGRASNLRTEAQTAADAAALAAVGNLKQQLRALALLQLPDIVTGPGVIDDTGLETASACAAAADYADRNGARLVGCRRSGLQVRVETETDESVGASAPDGVEGRRGEAEAVAEVRPVLLVDLPLQPLPPGLAGPGRPLPPGLADPGRLPPPFDINVDELFRFEVRLVA